MFTSRKLANAIVDLLGGKVKPRERGILAKYGNKKVFYNNQKFDSKKEARRYKELLLLQELGEIKELQTQVEFTLIPSQYEEINGKKRCIERPCKYRADFVYIDTELNAVIVEDTKGFKTKDYIIKRKLMLKEFGIRIKEV